MRKFTLLLALLCVSVMGWAIDWSGISYVPCDAGGDAYVNKFKVETTAGQNLGSIQNFQGAGWGIYTSFASGINSVTGVSSYRIEGAGVCLHCSSFADGETEVTVECALQTYTFTVYKEADSGSGGGGSIDWGEVSFVPGSSQYKVGALSPSDMPNEVVNIQKPGWAEEQGIYMTFPSADQLTCDLTCAVSGAGMVVYLSNFLGNEETEVNVTWNGGSKTFYVYNNAPMTLPSTKAPAPAVSAQRVRAVYSQYTYNTGMTMLGWSSAMTKTDVRVEGRQFPSFRFGNYLGLGYGSVYVSNMDNIHLDIWTENSFNIDFYLISPGTENAYTIELTGGTWNSVNIPLSTFSADKTRVTEFKFANATMANQTIFLDNIYFYANADLPDPDPSNVEDTNFALRTNGAIAYASSTNGENYSARAIDGDNGTLWESQWDVDPQTLTVDLGQRRIFNTIQMRLYERHPRDFYIETSNNGVDWTTRKTITDQTADVASGTEYTVELDANVTARYVRFRGTARANGYGYALYEFRVLLAGVPVLTSVTLTSDKKIARVGTYATLTAEPRDQNSSAIAASLSYTVSPADAGHVTDGKYYPEKYGLATITVTATTASDEVSNMVQVWGVVSDNLALNNALSEVGTWYGTYTSSRAVDGNDGTEWQGSTANGNIGDSRIYDAWFVVDLKANYNIQLISIHFEGACSDAYKIYASSDNVSWDEAYNYSGTNGIYNHTDYISTADLNNADNARYIKFLSTKAATDYGMKIYEMEVYGAEASSTKTVSATVNPAAAGIVTITAAGSPVTEVASGTEVTFTATPNDGYLFINWTQGGSEVSTDLEYVTTITSNTALIANFRALNHISCNEEMTSGDYTAYVTYKKTANENEYTLIIRSAQAMVNFTNAYVGHINGDNQINMNGQGELTGNGHKLSYTFTSTTEPKMNTPLYINFANHGEVTFNQINNGTVFEFAVPCAEPEITAITLDKTEATLDLGNTLTLVPSFTPAYMSADITWETSDDTKATVLNGVVTPVAPGSVTITAKVSESVKATCAITVQAAASHNWYGYGTSQDLDYTYRIEYTTDHHIVAHVKRQGDKTGLVSAEMLISGAWTTINNAEGEPDGWKNGTTVATFTAGDNIHILIQSAYAGPTSIIEFDYTVGADNEMPTIVPTSLALSNTSITMGLADEDIQLTTEIHHRDAANPTIIWTSDDETVATVANGLVHPVGVGTTTITAKCQADEAVSATCTVTVVGELEPATFWGNGRDGDVAIAYSITRNANHTLTYTIEALQDKVGFVVQVNDGDWHGNAAYNEGIYSWTSEATYTDGYHFSGFFYMPFEGGAARVDFVNYEVGSESARRYIPITVSESADNSSVLTASDGKIREVTVTRSFTVDNLYTLVLPFNVDAAQTVANLPGQLTKLNNTYVKENGDLRVNFVDASAIEAGVPYLYKPSANVTNPAFMGVTVDKNLNPTEPADELAKYYGIYAPTTGTALKTITNAYVLGQDQYLYNVQDLPDSQEMLALRGYFVLNFPPNPNPGPQRFARVVFNETQTPTDIENVQTGTECTKVIVNGQLQIIRDGKTYNAQGQLIK